MAYAAPTGRFAANSRVRAMNIAGQLRSGMSVEPAVDTKSASISDGT